MDLLNKRNPEIYISGKCIRYLHLWTYGFADQKYLTINQALEVARSEVNSHNYFLCKSTIFNGRIFHKIIKGLLISICIWEYYTKGSGTLLSGLS